MIAAMSAVSLAQRASPISLCKISKHVMMIAVAVSISGIVLSLLAQNTPVLIGFSLLGIVSSLGYYLGTVACNAEALQQTIKRLENQRIELVELHARQERAIESLHTEGNSLRNTVDEQSQQLLDLQNIQRQVEKRASEIHRSLEEEQKQKQALQQDCQTLASLNAKLSQTKEDLLKEAQQSTLKIQELKNELSRLQSSLQQLQIEKAGLEAEAQKLEGIFTRVQGIPKEVKQSTQDNLLLAKQLKKEILDLEKTYAVLEQKVLVKIEEYRQLSKLQIHK